MKENNSEQANVTLNVGDNSIVNNGTINIIVDSPSDDTPIEPVVNHTEIIVEEVVLDTDEAVRFAQETLITETHNHDSLCMAVSVDDSMTFGEAYASARAEIGPGGIFVWHGHVYNTFTAEEWNSMTAYERAEFNSNFVIDHPVDTISILHPDGIDLAQSLALTHGIAPEDIEIIEMGHADDIDRDYAIVNINGVEQVLLDVDGVEGYDVMLSRHGDHIDMENISANNLTPDVLEAYDTLNSLDNCGCDLFDDASTFEA